MKLTITILYAAISCAGATKLHAVFPSQSQTSERQIDFVAEEGRAVVKAMLYCMAGLFALIIGLLVSCFIVDVSLSWRHYATFQSLKRKIRRVQDALMKGKEDLSLCPCCVECTLNAQAAHRVKFICGHSFHLNCINSWFKDYPDHVGCCPVCENAMSGQELQECSGCSQPYKGDTGASGEAMPRDEAQTFILRSLHRRYPSFISKACVEHWAGCNAELWLSELTCPRYSSIFKVFFNRGEMESNPK
eukprot:TRINITY_DN113104_c0_g1_i1.p2 TRINITY_DN113104_c0_g1~~TRINITY_DN113104_c0_g1_i1.p2  ORF type:complete len:247 (-),score=41.85 TRINITY_DN113104_c0_g1_i1:30-770(-)